MNGPPMELNNKQIKYLKGLAHHLNPLVQMGKQGFSESFVSEVKRGLKDHELIKVRISCEDRAELNEITEQLPADTQSHLVQVIGHIAVLYKPSDIPKIILPKK
jgi:RNA-binding protein